MLMSCSTRASAIFSHAPEYAWRALPSLSSPVPAVELTAAAAFVAARPMAWGSVLCCGVVGETGAGVGRLVPLRFAAAKLVMPWPMVVPSSVMDSWIWVG